MSTTFTRTREEFAQLVLRKLGVLASGETMDTDDATIVYVALDLRLKELHEYGIKWWKLTAANATLTLSSSVTTVTLPSDFSIPHVLLVPDGASDISLEFIGHEKYMEIPDKNALGFPQKAYFNYADSKVYFWPVPTQVYNAKLTYEKITDDTAASTAPDVPVDMMRSLADVVAYDLLTEFPTSDPKIDAQITQRGLLAERNLSVFMVMKMEKSNNKLAYF